VFAARARVARGSLAHLDVLGGGGVDEEHGEADGKAGEEGCAAPAPLDEVVLGANGRRVEIAEVEERVHNSEEENGFAHNLVELDVLRERDVPRERVREPFGEELGEHRLAGEVRARRVPDVV